ncbi:MAG TPA: hypothetical protein VGD69_32885 [Herpetosiphonaceae bacterium]
MKPSTYPRFKHIAILCLVALSGVLSALLVIQFQASDQDHDVSIWPRPPQTIEELTQSADVIAIGTIGPIVNEGSLLGYDQNGQVTSSGTADDWPFVDIHVRVEQALKDDGTIRLEKPLTLRMPDSRSQNNQVTESDSALPMAQEGDRYLLFLTQNPDHQTYGLLYAGYSRLLIDGRVVTASDRARTSQIFGGTLTPADFVARVKAAIKAGDVK